MVIPISLDVTYQGCPQETTLPYPPPARDNSFEGAAAEAS